MRKKLIENTEPPKSKKKGWWTIVQEIQDIIVLNVFIDGILKYRHCIDTALKDYATYHVLSKDWTTAKVEYCYDIKSDWGYCSYDKRNRNNFKVSPEDSRYLLDKIPVQGWPVDKGDEFGAISRMEYEWGVERRESAEKRRFDRVNATMARIPKLPDDIEDWFYRVALGEDYAIKVKASKKYACTSCLHDASRKDYKRQDSKELARNNDLVICPHCGNKIKFLTRKEGIFKSADIMVVQPIDAEMSVIRYCEGTIICRPGEEKDICIYEKIRVLAAKYKNYINKNVYYNHGCRSFDNKSNPQNLKICIRQYLYDDGITGALEATKLEGWSALLTQMAAAGLELPYNNMITSKPDEKYKALVELLFRGRFYRLLAEDIGRMSYYGNSYCGDMNINGTSIEEVFKINDRQLINRIRDRNGGRLMLEWMRWGERHRYKIPDKVLTWLSRNSLWPHNMEWMKCRFSLEQAMNYIERQRREQYKGWNVKAVIDQYEDYMSMCEKLQKDTTDEMIFRPRELKRRHYEAVAEIKEHEAQITADEYSRRYPEAEKVLAQIAGKFEYSNEKYIIIVPRKNVQIVLEGRALHHCAGSSDRYFDRIAQQETYICFLRKAEEPDKPYYTIEVEPGGTIRQHRGEFDEEPEIEEVKPFLKEWQKVIRKRMSEQDHELAAVSAEKRIANIEELKAKNNTRVLDGLMEDFMEAI